ncbi:MAG: hypothetical protein AABW90_02065, partial [Nanoarchaeota archaeon]
EDNLCGEGSICSLGKCVEIACTKNSDCGIDGFIDNPFCQANDVYQNFQSFTCLNPGTLNSSCSININSKLIKSCLSEDVCSNGVCMDVGCHNDSECDDNNHLTFDQCTNPGTSASDCKNIPINCASDVDCGVDGFVGNEMCSDNDVIKNFQDAECNNPGTTNSFCTLDIMPKEINKCEFACVDSGFCISCNENSDCNDNKENTQDTCINSGKIDSFCSYEPIKCMNNNDCNDNNGHTLDICNNPGKTNSFCSYQDVVCLTDSECGNNGFVGNLFCDGSGNNDVYQNFVEFSCENPGTASSSCTQTISSLLVNECSDICSDGVCIDVVCNNNLDCSDNNKDTVDVCVNPGKIDSHCSHEEIACVSNNDCGTNRFTGKLFCQGKDLYRNFIGFSCNNTGTEQSFCSSNVNANFISSCRYACSNGECIRCNDNLDCNDNNKNTVDICRFEGSADSFCDYQNIICSKDSDCGADGFVDVPFCEEGNVHKKFNDYTCLNPGTSTSSCNLETTSVVVEDCNENEVCNNGMCVEVACSTNLDCNDNNNLTFDQCLNPGTPASKCINTPINCASNVDCGTDKFIDGEFCSDNGVFKNFKTFTCLNPGTTSSSCNSEIEPKLIQQCTLDQTCSNGMCLEVMCKKDIDCGEDKFIGDKFCKDGEVFQNFKVFSCVNLGSQNSECLSQVDPIIIEQCNFECSNGKCIEQIKCSKDSDCGNDGFVDRLFCQNNDVYQNFKTFKCNNPNTVASYCSSNINSQLVQMCVSGEICSEGACILPKELCEQVIIYAQEDPQIDDTTSFFNRGGLRIHNQKQKNDRYIFLNKDIIVVSDPNGYIKELIYTGKGNEENSKHRFEAFVRDIKGQNIEHILITDTLNGHRRITKEFLFSDRNAKSVFWPEDTRLGQYGKLYATFCSNS